MAELQVLQVLQNVIDDLIATSAPVDCVTYTSLEAFNAFKELHDLSAVEILEDVYGEEGVIGQETLLEIEFQGYKVRSK